MEFSTIQRKNGIINKILRFLIRKFNKTIHPLLSKLYFGKVDEVYYNKKEKTTLNGFERFFINYGKLIDLQVEVAFLLRS